MVAVPHPKWDERPVAIVVPVAGQAAPSVAEVYRHLEKSRFAKYQWPDDVLVWDEIPFTGTWKMDKKVARKKLQETGYTLPSLRGNTGAAQSRL